MLSVAIFAGNEEKHIEHCLKSLMPLAPEIIFVNTHDPKTQGDPDKTLDIVKKYTSKIYHEPWKNDFSYHRNHSFSLCTGKWILQIDADEEIIFDDPKNGPAIFLSKLATAKKDVHGVSMVMKDWRETQKRYNAEFDVVRLFKRGHVTWKRRVHNKWHYTGDTAVIFGVHLKHYGYDLTEEQKDKKALRTISLLEQSLKDDPSDYDCYFYLAQAHGGFKNDADKALEYSLKYIGCKEHFEDPKEFNTSIFHLAFFVYFKRKDYENASKIIQTALKNDSLDLDILYDWIQLGTKLKDPKVIGVAAQRFIHAFENLPELRKKSHGRFYFNYRLESYAEALYYLSITHLESGVIELNKLKNLFDKIPKNHTDGIKEKLKRDLSSLKIKGLIDESKIITDLNSHNPLLPASGRAVPMQDFITGANRSRL
jgi:glycosyltransferase involved in cell wall biosynthesis